MLMDERAMPLNGEVPWNGKSVVRFPVLFWLLPANGSSPSFWKAASCLKIIQEMAAHNSSERQGPEWIDHEFFDQWKKKKKQG